MKALLNVMFKLVKYHCDNKMNGHIKINIGTEISFDIFLIPH